MKKWTSEEIENLKHGKHLERSLPAILSKRKKLGINSIKLWTNEEIEILKKGEVPPRRKADSSYRKAKILCIDKQIINILSKKRTKELRIKKSNIKHIKQNIELIDKNLILKKFGWS